MTSAWRTSDHRFEGIAARSDVSNSQGIFGFSRYKIARAKQHITDLEREINAFHASHPYERVVELDPDDPSKSLHKFKLTQPLPWILDCIVGDAVHNLRDALDTAVYSIAIAAGKTDPKHTAFPFAGSPEHFERNALGRCKDLPKEILAVFRAYQPYRAGNDMLWALNDICVRSKHTLLAPLGTAFQSGDIIITGNTAVMVPLDPVWDRDKNEVVFARLSTGAEITYHFGFTLQIAFCQIPVVDSEPVCDVLEYFVDLAEDILAALETATRCLGIGE
jgi:hypothetical protein